jgi:hypothetical protein
VQNIAAKFAHHRNDSNRETLTQCRKIARICERTWKTIGDRSQRPCYPSRFDHERKIRSRKQKTDIGKYQFANRTIQPWNQLPEIGIKVILKLCVGNLRDLSVGITDGRDLWRIQLRILHVA